MLNEVERENIVTHGYGLHSFLHALVGTFERLSVEPLTPGLHDTICGFAHAIAEQPIELIAGVEPTLRYLEPRHRLMLMTKGNPVEQLGKIERSGLSGTSALWKSSPRRTRSLTTALSRRQPAARNYLDGRQQP